MSEINYEHTLDVEVLNEYSANVVNKLQNHLESKDIDIDDKNNTLAILWWRLVRISNQNLFQKTDEELNQLLFYWQEMDGYISQITTTLGETA